MHALHNRTPGGFRSGRNAGMIPCTQLQDLKFGRPILPVNFPAPGQPVDELGVGGDQECHSRQACGCHRQGRRHGDQARLVQGGRAGAARSHRAPLADGRKAELRCRPASGSITSPWNFDRPSVHRRPEQYGLLPGSRRRLAIWVSAFQSCANASPMRRSAMAASGGSRPASWRAWRRLRSLAIGYGIRYDFGLFRQIIAQGWQQEYPDEC